MKQQRLEVPQRTLYGIHRPQRYQYRDPAPHIGYGDEFPPMQHWEKVAWSMIVGFVGGFLVLGGYFGFPW